jgi:hexosaminidase
MSLQFSTRIDGTRILCEIGSDTALSAPIFCFSLMTPPRVISGGDLVRSIAGYAEVALPDIAAGVVHKVVLEYARAEHFPRNRAWLPLGAYLRQGKTCLPLPPGTVQGVVAGTPPMSPALPPRTLPLIPAPSSWKPSEGEVTFSAIASEDRRLQGVADLAERCGFGAFRDVSGCKLTIVQDDSFPSEGYRLDITKDRITLTVSDDHGVHNAGITLLTLHETLGGKLPCGVITDAPRFGYRGQHLDCARHFYALPSILRLLDLMALMKMNRFHWHFADDEAFRLEVSTAPELWKQTAFRGEGCLMPGIFGGGIRSGGTYSKADVATILKRAAELHIDVLPEIEIPAHSHAMIAIVPGLRDPGDNGEERSVQGYLDNIVNPAMPGTWALLEPLMLEVAALFPMAVLHMGCDEAPHGAWSGSPLVAELKAREGLVDSDDVQGWMMARLAGVLVSKAIRPAAWQEAAKGRNGGIGHGALLFSWTGQGPGIEAARRGHDVVMCPAQNAYFDLAHSADPGDWGAAWAGFVSLEKTVDWDPVPKGAEDIEPRIAGVESCLWGEVVTEDWQMEALIAPRILGIATKAWEVRGRTDGLGLRALAAAYGPLLDRMGWARHKGA